MRSVLRLTRALLLGLALAAWLGPRSAQPALSQSGPSISVNPVSGPPGTVVNVSGSGFAADANVSVNYDGAQILIVGTGTGSWATNFAVPPSASGVHTISAGLANAPFQVTPVMTLSTAQGAPGSRITVTGAGFPASLAQVVITLDGRQVGTTNTSLSGAFSVAVTIPSGPGAYRIFSAGNAPPVGFQVISTLALAPASGPHGTTVVLNGSGFQSGEQVSVYYEGGLVKAVTADSQGILSVVFQIPISAGGSRVISWTSSTGVSQATFQVTPTLALTPSVLPAGGSMHILGTGFFPFESGIGVILDNNVLASGIIASATGQWTADVAVPQSVGGNRTVLAGGRNSTVEATLQIGPLLKVDGSVTPGNAVKLSGAGYRNKEANIRITVGDSLVESVVSADEKGVWSSDVRIPPIPSGLLPVRVFGPSSGGAESVIPVIPAISLSSPVSSPGSNITVRGAGFRANQGPLEIMLNGQVVATASADRQGSWVASFVMPPAGRGSYMLRVNGGPLGELETRLTIGAALLLRERSGVAGTSLSISGQGFEPNENAITLSFGDEVLLSGLVANAEGAWSTSVQAPALPSGAYPIRASGSRTSSAAVREELFALTPGLSFSPLAAPPGANLTVTGQGFQVGEKNITLTLNNVPLASGISADPRGNWTVTLPVPAAAGGELRFSVNAPATQAIAVRTPSFTVLPSFGATPATGVPGAQLAVRGSGFPAKASGLTLAFDGFLAAANLATDEKGALSTLFTLPQTPFGEHRLTIINPGAPPLSATVQVTPLLTVSPESGTPGTRLTVSGAGFEANRADLVIDLDGAPLVSEVATAADGSFTRSVTLPAAAAGRHVLGVRSTFGLTSQRLEQALTVKAVAALSRSEAQEGSVVTLTGQGFAPDSLVYVTEQGGQTLSTAKSNSLGNVRVELKAPPAPAGQVVLKLADEAGNESLSVLHVQALPLPPPPKTSLWTRAARIGGSALAVMVAALAVFFVLRRRAATAMGPGATYDPLGPAPQRPSLPSGSALALPRGQKGLPSTTDRARLVPVVEFARSIPLNELSKDLLWLEDFAKEGATVSNEDLLGHGEPPRYQPTWLNHPSFHELNTLMPAHPFNQQLQRYVQAVDECAAEATQLLRSIRDELAATILTAELPKPAWPYVLGVAQDAVAWLGGSFLQEPSLRDYLLRRESVGEAGAIYALTGDNHTPFSGLLVEGVSEESAFRLRDSHIRLRTQYRGHELTRGLVRKMSHVEVLRQELDALRSGG